MIQYTPFKDNEGNNKNFKDINFEDLQVLVDVEENYSIEYKQNLNI